MWGLQPTQQADTKGGSPTPPSLLTGDMEGNHFKKGLSDKPFLWGSSSPCILTSPSPKGLSFLLAKQSIAPRISVGPGNWQWHECRFGDIGLHGGKCGHIAEGGRGRSHWGTSAHLLGRGERPAMYKSSGKLEQRLVWPRHIAHSVPASHTTLLSPEPVSLVWLLSMLSEPWAFPIPTYALAEHLFQLGSSWLC
jgi:hypothetical protein